VIAIVTDSEAHLPPQVTTQHDVYVVPSHVEVGGKSYKAGVELTSQQYLYFLKNAAAPPTTSPPSPGEFYAIYMELLAAGYGILSVHASHHLSGTLQSARAAQELLPGADITLVDSKSISLGEGLIVLYAARLAEEGFAARDIRRALRPMIRDMQLFFVLETLEYLRRGKRVGGLTRLVSTLGGLQPVLTLRDGKIKPAGWRLNRVAALNRLRQLALDRGKNQPGLYLGVGHVGAHDQAQALADQLQAKIKPAQFLFGELGPAVTAYTGPNALALALYPLTNPHPTPNA
jgi:DegV family protein with EDD domain